MNFQNLREVFLQHDLIYKISFIFVTGAMVQEIRVHLQHLFSEIQPKFNVTDSILKKMVELNSLSTRMRKCIYFMNFIVQGLDFGRRLEFWECFEHHCTFISAVWKRNRLGFAALYGIHVEFFFDSVFFSVNVSLLVFYVYHFLSYFFLT